MSALQYLYSRGLAAKQVGNKLSVTPRAAITQECRLFIILHRMTLLAELAANDGMERRAHWKVSRGGIEIATIAGGPMSQQEALEAAQFRWPDCGVLP